METTALLAKKFAPAAVTVRNVQIFANYVESIAATVKIGPVNSVTYLLVVGIMPIVIYVVCV